MQPLPLLTPNNQASGSEFGKTSSANSNGTSGSNPLLSGSRANQGQDGLSSFGSVFHEANGAAKAGGLSDLDGRTSTSGAASSQGGLNFNQAFSGQGYAVATSFSGENLPFPPGFEFFNAGNLNLEALEPYADQIQQALSDLQLAASGQESLSLGDLESLVEGIELPPELESAINSVLSNVTASFNELGLNASGDQGFAQGHPLLNLINAFSLAGNIEGGENNQPLTSLENSLSSAIDSLVASLPNAATSVGPQAGQVSSSELVSALGNGSQALNNLSASTAVDDSVDASLGFNQTVINTKGSGNNLSDSGSLGVQSSVESDAGSELVSSSLQYRRSLSASSNTALTPSAVNESDQSFKAMVDQASSNIANNLSSEAVDESLQKAEAGTRTFDIQSRPTNPTTRTYATTVQTAVNDPDWSNQVNDKVLWLSSRNIQSAQIHLNPAELGPIDIKVSIQNDQAVVNFNAQNANVRDLLEANVQRLRDMLDANGVEQAQVNVDSGDSGQSGASFASSGGDSDGRPGNNNASTSEQDISSENSEARVSRISEMNLVDDYV